MLAPAQPRSSSPCAEKGGTDAVRPFGTDPASPLGRGSPRPGPRPGARASRSPHWSDRDRQLTHYPGHDRDMMYLAVPLRGDFQLDCELTSSAGRQIQVVYGGLAVGPKLDLKSPGSDRSLGRPLSDLTRQSAAREAGRLVRVSG